MRTLLFIPAVIVSLNVLAMHWSPAKPQVNNWTVFTDRYHQVWSAPESELVDFKDVCSGTIPFVLAKNKAMAGVVFKPGNKNRFAVSFGPAARVSRKKMRGRLNGLSLG